MGSKTPGILRSQRLTCKCDACGLGFKNVQSLRSHQVVAHPRKKRVAYKPKTEVIIKRKAVPIKKVVKTVTKLKKVPKVSVENETSEVKQNPDDKGIENEQKFEFECPVCSKIFNAYFAAHKHIQKTHRVDAKGNAVSENSPYLIKPQMLELCTICKKRVISPHNCTALASVQLAPNNYQCFGCEEQFFTVPLYALHIPSWHSNGAENLFFPNMNEVKSWTLDLESKPGNKYTILTMRGHTHVFQCEHVVCKNGVSKYCPASYTVQENEKGVQIVFYKTHFGHSVEEYVLPEKFKTYSVGPKLWSDQSYSVTTKPCDEYDAFKKLMENLILGAAKLNSTYVKVLHDKAVEMSFIINSYKIENETPTPTNKKVTDNEISDLLKDGSKKRKNNENETDKDVKKLKADTDSNVKSDATDVSGKLTPNMGKSTAKDEANKIDLSPKPTPWRDSPKSFNDTYKNFVSANLNVTIEKPKRERRKEVVKTKIGQFKPSPTSKEKIAQSKPSPPIKEKIAQPKQSPPIKEKNAQPKPPQIKEKIAPPKPSPPVKEASKVPAKLNKESINNVAPKVKLDFEYEVVERDNDCNILVIKF